MIPSIIDVKGVYVSSTLLTDAFCCDVAVCKGGCCVEGASGAPLEKEEQQQIERDLPTIAKYLPKENYDTIKEQGCGVIDEDGDLVTPLLNDKECAFAKWKNGTISCTIEEAYNAGEISFTKPLSCHLYPVRITQYKDFEAVNYEKIDLCKGGRSLGIKKNLPLFRFLKTPLIRKYGVRWYEELKDIYKELKKEHL